MRNRKLLTKAADSAKTESKEESPTGESSTDESPKPAPIPVDEGDISWITTN